MVDGDADSLALDMPAEEAKDERRLKRPGAPLRPMAVGGRSIQERAVATLLAVLIAKHMARGRDACLSISFALLTAGVGQKADIGDGVGNLRATGAAGGCIGNRVSNR